jgi:hypothetical protein
MSFGPSPLANPTGRVTVPRGVNSADMTDQNAEQESEVDPDEAIRAEIRAKLRGMTAERVDRSRGKRPLTSAEQAPGVFPGGTGPSF